jgi:cutinase
VAARSIQRLPQSIKDRIGAVVLFGYTQNQQLNGGIPGFPDSKVKVFCNIGDLVCLGTLTLLAPHFTYGLRTDDAVRFIYSTIGRV